MKKIAIAAILLLTLTASFTGCGKTPNRKADKTASKPAAASTSNKNSESSNPAQSLNDVKNLDDNKLIDQISKDEETININDADADLQDTDIIDSILNDKDPIADIPAYVKAQ